LSLAPIFEKIEPGPDFRASTCSWTNPLPTPSLMRVPLPVPVVNPELSSRSAISAVSGRLAQLVLPGDNPDVASLILEHENGALSTLNASYASAAEHYVVNVSGKEASPYYDLPNGLRFLRRGSERAEPVACARNDPVVEELEEFVRAVRVVGVPEMGGEAATGSLAVLRPGIKSARENRRVTGREILDAADE
jgi:predicted dehydrogenase